MLQGFVGIAHLIAFATATYDHSHAILKSAPGNLAGENSPDCVVALFKTGAEDVLVVCPHAHLQRDFV